MADESTPNVLVEKEKTKRTLISVSALVLVSLVGMYFFFSKVDNREGTFKVNKDGISIELNKPLIQQSHLPATTVTAFNDTVQVISAPIPDSVIQAATKKGVDVSGGSFSGKNLIDTVAGFVIATDNPSAWQVERIKPNSTETKLTSGATTIHISTAPQGNSSAHMAAQRLLDSLLRKSIPAKLDTSTSTTALVWYKDAASNTTVCIKYQNANGKLLTARASTTNSNTVQDMVRTVAGFTAISPTKRAVVNKQK